MADDVYVDPELSELAAEGFLECLTAIERGEQPARTVDRERGY